jgi:hypothetical protein
MPEEEDPEEIEGVSEIVRGPRNLIKGRVLLRVTRTRARNQ